MVELFSRDYGRVSLVAKGAKAAASKKTRGGSQAALLQPFVPLLCSWSGRSELRTSTGCEPRGPAMTLQGKQVYCGLYVNELMNRLLHHDDAHNDLFGRYEQVLADIRDTDQLDLVLRQFEFRLLESLGYGFDLQTDGLSGDPVADGQWYVFHNEHGLVAARGETGRGAPRFSGEELLRISRGEFDENSRQCAKRLMRTALAVHLGAKPLKSRELFGAIS